MISSSRRKERLASFSAGRLGFFPKPFADELLFSVICRFYVLTQPPGTWTTTVSALLNKEKITLNAEYLPTRIRSLASRMPEGHVLADPYWAAGHHTALNYSTYFHTQSQRADAAERLLGDTSLMLIFKYVGLNLTPVALNKPLKFCTRCTEEDYESVGTPYWHLSHQLPGVFVCWKHGVQLTHGCSACDGMFEDRKDIRLPPVRLCNIKGHIHQDFKIPFQPKDDCLHELAIAAHQMTLNPNGFTGLWKPAMKAALIEAGYRRGGRISTPAVMDALDARYGSDMVYWCNFRNSRETDGDYSKVWRITSKSEYRHNALKQLMLTLLLGRSFCEAEATLQSMPVALDREADKPETGDGSVSSERSVESTQHGSDQVSETQLTKEEILDRISNWHQRGTTQADWLMVDSNPEALESLADVSPSLIREFVERVHIDHGERCRNTMIEAFERSPNLTRAMAKLGNTAAHRWLCRHDAAWYDEFLKSQSEHDGAGFNQRFRWNQRSDQKIAELVRVEAAYVRKFSPNLQITTGRLMRFAGVPLTVRTSPELWPLTNRAIAESIEPKAAFIDRRIVAALEILSTRKQAIFLNDVQQIYQIPVLRRLNARDHVARLCSERGMTLLQ